MASHLPEAPQVAFSLLAKKESLLMPATAMHLMLKCCSASMGAQGLALALQRLRLPAAPKHPKGLMKLRRRGLAATSEALSEKELPPSPAPAPRASRLVRLPVQALLVAGAQRVAQALAQPSLEQAAP